MVKDAPAEQLAGAIRRVAAGERVAEHRGVAAPAAHAGQQDVSQRANGEEASTTPRASGVSRTLA